jgi:hypothetical protein
MGVLPVFVVILFRKMVVNDFGKVNYFVVMDNQA